MTLISTLLALAALALVAMMLTVWRVEGQAREARQLVATQRTRIRWLEDALTCQQQRITYLVGACQEQEQIMLDQAAIIERLDKATRYQAFWYVAANLPAVDRTYALTAKNRISLN